MSSIKMRWSKVSRDGQRYYRVSAKRIRTPAGSAQPHCPTPSRKCPMRIFQAHEVHPEDDIDWTVAEAKGDSGEDISLRYDRNLMIKQSLIMGESVQYRSTGSSLWPDVKSGDCCLFEPIYYCDKLQPGQDIVFCEVQPHDRFCAHKILRCMYERTAASAPGGESWKRYWIIGNNSGRENGWCYDHHLYG